MHQEKEARKRLRLQRIEKGQIVKRRKKEDCTDLIKR